MSKKRKEPDFSRHPSSLSKKPYKNTLRKLQAELVNVADIKSDVRDGEYEPAAALVGDSHEGHTAPVHRLRSLDPLRGNRPLIQLPHPRAPILHRRATAGVLALWGILLTPAVGAILMSASTVVVAINAQLLKRVKL